MVLTLIDDQAFSTLSLKEANNVQYSVVFKFKCRLRLPLLPGFVYASK